MPTYLLLYHSFFLSFFRRKYRNITWKFDCEDKPSILKAQQGNNAGLIGAAKAAYDRYRDNSIADVSL